jgi:hypothetical protein
MEKIDSIEISDGATSREVSLYHGDLLELGAGPPVDLLVASAFPNDYVPSATSLIGALHHAGLDVAELARDKQIDLRAGSGFWLSREIGDDAGWRGARRLAVFEPIGLGSPPETVGALFRGLFPFLSDTRDQTVALPLLAAGDQGWSALVMMEALLDASIQWMERGLPVSELMIFERDERRIERLRRMLQEMAVAPPVRRGGLLSGPAHDVFLSFSSRNADAADRFVGDLVALRPEVRIFDYRLSIDKGRPYQNEIDRAIESCAKVVPILSPAYLASPECQEELNIARLRNKRSGWSTLIPIYWKSVVPELPLWLQTLNIYQCTEERPDLMPGAAQAVSDSL